VDSASTAHAANQALEERSDGHEGPAAQVVRRPGAAEASDVTSTLRTAGCGPARPVVWDGSGGPQRLRQPLPDSRFPAGKYDLCVHHCLGPYFSNMSIKRAGRPIANRSLTSSITRGCSLVSAPLGRGAPKDSGTPKTLGRTCLLITISAAVGAGQRMGG